MAKAIDVAKFFIEIVAKFKLPFTEKDFIGTRDKSNHLVLPQEYDYAE